MRNSCQLLFPSIDSKLSFYNPHSLYVLSCVGHKSGHCNAINSNLDNAVFQLLNLLSSVKDVTAMSFGLQKKSGEQKELLASLCTVHRVLCKMEA